MPSRRPSKAGGLWGADRTWHASLSITTLSSGAQPRKCGLPSQPPASLFKSHCSWLGTERPNPPPRPWSPLHPLSIQNQFIWVIFKAQRLGQLERAASSRPNAWGFFQPRAYVLRVRARALRYGQSGSERFANQTFPAASQVWSKQKALFFGEVSFLAPNGRSLSSAAQRSSALRPRGIWASGSGSGSLVAGAKPLSQPLQKGRWLSRGNGFTLFALLSSSSGVTWPLLRGPGGSWLYSRNWTG